MSNDPNRLPSRRDSPSNGAAADEDLRALRVDVLHYHANDLTELRKIAELNPDLAKQIVSNADSVDRREQISFRIGVAVTGAVALTLIAGLCFVLIFLGWWQSLFFIGAVLAASHFLRVFLTGEWSETSWIGKLFAANPPSEKGVDDD